MTTEQQAHLLSQSLAAHVAAYHRKMPVTPELTIAAAVDFLAACMAVLHSGDPDLDRSLLDVATSTLKDRVTHYAELKVSTNGKVH